MQLHIGNNKTPRFPWSPDFLTLFNPTWKPYLGSPTTDTSTLSKVHRWKLNPRNLFPVKSRPEFPSVLVAFFYRPLAPVERSPSTKDLSGTRVTLLYDRCRADRDERGEAGGNEEFSWYVATGEEASRVITFPVITRCLAQFIFLSTPFLSTRTRSTLLPPVRFYL